MSATEAADIAEGLPLRDLPIALRDLSSMYTSDVETEMSTECCELDRVLEAVEHRGNACGHSPTVVEVVPLDESLRPSGSIRPGVMREISDCDISLLAHVPPSVRYLRVRFPGESPTTMLYRVVRCEPLGCLCEIDGRLIAEDDATLCRGSRA